MLVDSEQRIVAVLAGQPVGDDSWLECMAQVEEAMTTAAGRITLRMCGNCRNKGWDERCSKCRNRRGDFKSVTAGISYGNGQKAWMSFWLMPPLTVIYIETFQFEAIIKGKRRSSQRASQ